MTQRAAQQEIKVLIVDDNASYRDAFRRNLMMQGYQVCEAGGAEEAVGVLERDQPHVVITDLQMGSHREGLELIRRIRASDPLLPVIMISAVGTFEEGAEATRLGAAAVIHKSHIEEEIEGLYRHINSAFDARRRALFSLHRIRDIRSREGGAVRPEEREQLRSLMMSPDSPEVVRAEAFDALETLNEEDSQRAAAETVREFMSEDQAEAVLENVETIITRELPPYGQLEPESSESLRNAEFLFQQQSMLGSNIDFSRNIGFSYCFAVENEAKARLRKRLTRFLSSRSTGQTIEQMLDPKRKGLNLFFHQRVYHAMKGRQFEITFDNIKQTLDRILQHGPRYKPDGLKALGIVILCFARDYEFVGNRRERVLVQSPLSLKGIEKEEDVLTFAELLISLQHYRNPYIHPEINDLTKLSKIRTTSYVALNIVSKLT